MSIEAPKLFTLAAAKDDFLHGQVGLGTLYAAARSGELATIRIGRRILVSDRALTAWLEKLTRAAS